MIASLRSRSASTPAVLATTRGFEEVIEIGRQNRPRVYSRCEIRERTSRWETRSTSRSRRGRTRSGRPRPPGRCSGSPAPGAPRPPS
ncbi:MAG: hypothetical protein DMG07_00695 [Acidobacteria bacterium]|nr:MAG: hypothetical protein DMG07_00695 [Acidobacteriota bacterium]